MTRHDLESVFGAGGLLRRACALGPAVLAVAAACGAKTDPFRPPAEEDVADAEAAVDLPPTARCMEAELWSSPGKVTVVGARGTDREGPVTYEWRMIEAPAGSTAAPDPIRTPNTTLIPDLLGTFRLRLTVTDRGGRIDSCDTVIHSVTDPPTALCPPAVEAASIGVPITLEGDGEDDGEIVAFEWSVLDAPAGSSARPAPADAPTTVFTPDVEGIYEIRFAVTDDHGYRDHCIVVVNALGAPPLECPREPIVAPTRRPVVLSIRVLNAEPVTWRWEVRHKPSVSTASEPSPPGSPTPSFTPDKPGRYVIRGIATNARALESWCDIEIEATPTGPDVTCPPDRTIRPLDTVELSGAHAEDDGIVVSYRWELVERPSGSAARPPEPETARVPTFTVDLVGVYVIRLTVRDDDGNEASCTFRLTAMPSEGLRIEMYWNPPDRSCATTRPPCDPTDVDMHMIHPNAPNWFHGTLDCYFANCDPPDVLPWDAPGRRDDPRLDLDDTDGHGPENINIDEPVVGHVYTVGVHYWSDDGYGPVPVYIRVYCSTISADPVATFGPVTVRRSGVDFWRVATVRWTGYTCEVTSLARSDGTPNIITQDEATRGR
ncbi:MAG: hypothetical protein QME96_01210 [Myxococcota bacterium]|nr:hypothetical protein [Myxococcota bacterium]